MKSKFSAPFPSIVGLRFCLGIVRTVVSLKRSITLRSVNAFQFFFCLSRWRIDLLRQFKIPSAIRALVIDLFAFTTTDQFSF